jgi:alkanesulfonate monooxygenase SsuD/methylene tetrahydromethanopterin reductase-like flavin-dependent oxidoreductase (luciferase family)
MSLSSSYGNSDARQGARDMIARAAAAREADLDSLFVGDHHSTGPGSYYQNVPILGRLLAEWGDRPAGALFLLPLWHPVLLAEQVGTLAAIHEGRFILQCAVGPDGDGQMDALGVPRSHRPSRFEESLEIMRRLWAGERVSHSGRWTFSNAQIAPVPPEPVEVWVGAGASAPIDRAARAADGWLAAPRLSLSKASALSAEYLERCEAHGRSPQAIPIRRDVCIAESDEAARAAVADVVEDGYRGIEPETLIIGGPETAADAFRALAGVGFTDIIARNISPDQSVALNTIRWLGEVRGRIADA